MVAPHRVLVALNLPRHVPDLLKFGKLVNQSMTNNPHFTNPPPALAALSVDLPALEVAETNAKTRVQGAVDVRNAKREAVEKDLRALQAYIQGVADADPANADAIISSAGVSKKKTSPRSKAAFEARQSAVSGSVELFVKAVARVATYFWEFSTDDKTWTAADPTMKAKTTIAGLVPGTTYYFRYRTLTRDGQSDWSQSIKLLVK